MFSAVQFEAELGIAVLAPSWLSIEAEIGDIFGQAPGVELAHLAITSVVVRLGSSLVVVEVDLPVEAIRGTEDLERSRA